MTALKTDNPLAAPTQSPSDLLTAVLAESRELTAVERFAKQHDAGDVPAQAKHYRDLIPAGAPGVGEQYAFDVDLDACSGCKACVSACHHLNGLETNETWRWVGQLSGSNGLPVIQHVTTACHHCVDPGCLNGCPTNAYEKDPETGVVRHLDDQCFGCQYCTMACPYEVPQYSPSKGIVRKCDMCHGRLAAGEAPACVQACPNQAIRITVVDTAETIARTDADKFLPDSPPAQLTHPATLYRTERGLPENAVGFDYDHAEPQHAHLPLVAMLVLTQFSVGAVAIGVLLRWLGVANPGWISGADAAIVLGAAVGQAGLAAATLHLGRPHLAFRAVLGWRHSWLSREAIVFGAYAATSIPAALFAAMPLIEAYAPGFVTSLLKLVLPGFARPAAEALAILTGAAGVFCSAKIYLFTGREFWLGARTGLKFGGTAVVLGLSGTLAAVACVGVWLGEAAPSGWMALLAVATIVATAAKLWYERSITAGPHDLADSLRLTAKLLCGPLKLVSNARIASAALGGLLFPLVTLGVGGYAAAVITFVGLMLLTLGELAERALYFAAVVPLRMPGGLKS